MKRRIFVAQIILIILSLLVLTNGLVGCNRQIADFNYRFNRAVIHFGDMEIEVKSWRDWEDSDVVQVTSTDGTVYYTHSSNVILMYIPD